ncbi:MAG: site-specific DNA-methyltransferase, partial [Chloroflexi bacterium]|nr:site-specific DNA-methyltransferase [Chloroflexota bacterium]
MARAPRKPKATAAEVVEAYQYGADEATRKNNPEAGLATYEKSVRESKQYKYDPHLDPQLVWAGKEERDDAGLSVDTVSLHIHERVSTPQIIRQARREEPKQLDLFADPHLPLGEAIEFYQHDVNWSNRLVLGDSLLVMNSLLEREGMGGKVQMIYIDPPYGIAYNSNFQPATNRRDVQHGKDADLTREPEMIKAYRDTWRVGVHSYLTYLRDRLKLARELLTDSGSIFVQISDENVHHVREIMDEVFGAENACGIVTFQKTGSTESTLLGRTVDFLIWYAKDRATVKYRQLYLPRAEGTLAAERYDYIERDDGGIARASSEHRARETRRVQLTSMFSDGQSREDHVPFTVDGREFMPKAGTHWKTGPIGRSRLLAAGRVVVTGNTVRYKRYLDDFPVTALADRWEGIQIGTERAYVVQTSTRVIERCLLMTTDPGDLVLDPTCGSGTTAYVAEQWGRRWITCDSSRVALSIARQRLLTASFPYYSMAYPAAGVSGGFQYETVPHITLKSIAQNTRLDRVTDQTEIDRIIREDGDQETLYDRPLIDRAKVRVSGPFTVEAIPIPAMAAAEESMIEAYPDRDDHAGRLDTSAADYIDTLIGLLRKDGVTFP